MDGKVIFFMAASGILVAVLLVWAQLWITTAIEYKDKKYSTKTAAISLSYVYYAISASIIAFTISLITYSVSRCAIILLMFAITLGVLLVIGSLYAAISKAHTGGDILKPSNFFAELFEIKCFRIIALYIIPSVIIILCCLIVAIFPSKDTFLKLIG